jgi:glutamate racemase
VPEHIEVLSQGTIIAERLAFWLGKHADQEKKLSRGGRVRFATTDDSEWFARRGERLLGRPITAERVRLKG